MKIDDSLLTSRGVKPVRVPLTEIAQREGGNKIMMNTASLAVAAGMTGLPFEYIQQVIVDNFGNRKGSATVFRCFPIPTPKSFAVTMYCIPARGRKAETLPDLPNFLLIRTEWFVGSILRRTSRCARGLSKSSMPSIKLGPPGGD